MGRRGGARRAWTPARGGGRPRPPGRGWPGPSGRQRRIQGDRDRGPPRPHSRRGRRRHHGHRPALARRAGRGPARSTGHQRGLPASGRDDPGRRDRPVGWRPALRRAALRDPGGVAARARACVRRPGLAPGRPRARLPAPVGSPGGGTGQRDAGRGQRRRRCVRAVVEGRSRPGGRLQRPRHPRWDDRGAAARGLVRPARRRRDDHPLQPALPRDLGRHHSGGPTPDHRGGARAQRWLGRGRRHDHVPGAHRPRVRRRRGVRRLPGLLGARPGRRCGHRLHRADRTAGGARPRRSGGPGRWLRPGERVHGRSSGRAPALRRGRAPRVARGGRWRAAPRALPRLHHVRRARPRGRR